MDVHPPKNGINRYWSIPKCLPVCQYSKVFQSLKLQYGFLWTTFQEIGDTPNWPFSRGTWWYSVGIGGYPIFRSPSVNQTVMEFLPMYTWSFQLRPPFIMYRRFPSLLRLFTTPLKNMSSSVGMMTSPIISNNYMESHTIPWFHCWLWLWYPMISH